VFNREATESDVSKHLLMLLNDGADPNAIAHGGYLNTAIHIAGINGHGDLVTALAGWPHTDINAPNYAHQTPLHYAAEGGNAEAVRAILVSGRLLEVSPRDAKFETPLHFAANHGYTDVRPAIVLRSLTVRLLLRLNGPPLRGSRNVSASSFLA
jgi:ankyrin repeat protein